MTLSKIRENDYYKYGIELPLLFSACVNAFTAMPATCVLPVAVSAISSYTSFASEKEGAVRGNPVSRLFNLAAGITCGILTGVGLDGIAQNLDAHNYLIGTLTDTAAAFIAYSSTRLCGKVLAPEPKP